MIAKTNTILIVDDEVINLRMLERLLGSRYAVVTATNGLAALEILKQVDVSLLISDQRMPGMTGIELLRASRSINPDLVCMLVTANTDEDTSIEAINDAGALRVIHKPWKGQTVLQFVEETLAQRETLIECKQANAQIELALSQLRLAAEELSLVSKHE
jgi:response regulator RpfG family c-di-GMP phosphodiesterase